MVGTFSLLDVLLNMSTKEILQQVPLAPVVNDALAEHAGGLGKLLGAIEAAEAGELKLAASTMKELGIKSDLYCDAQLTSYSWAAKIRPTAWPVVQ
ncbi:MAG: hypothetical protein IPL05_00130 [Betaproteobacteria bacterium]|nr:hypothetical protein [Betaproteobacteria bacterium]